MDPTSKTFFMPEGISTFSAEVDSLYYFVYWVSVFFFVLIVTLMLGFVIRYRRKSEADTTPAIHHNTTLEIVWTVGPTFLLVLMFLWGFQTYLKLRVAPPGALEVQVTGQQWFWTFTYPDGTSALELAVPVNQPVKFLMSSKDVIHSFDAPNFRQKMDVVPNRYTTTWFQATKIGDYPLFCSEYCGRDHSAMITAVHVMNREKFDEWMMTGGLGDISKLPLVKQGELIAQKRGGCLVCHNTTDPAPKTGPSWKGIFGKPVKLADGRTVTVDENYLRKSMMDPAADVVAGFTPVMPTFKGALKDDQVNAIIAYIKSLN